MERKKKVQIDEDLFYDLIKYFNANATNKDIEKSKKQIEERIKMKLDEKLQKMSAHDYYTKAKNKNQSKEEREFNFERYKDLKGF